MLRRPPTPDRGAGRRSSPARAVATEPSATDLRPRKPLNPPSLPPRQPPSPPPPDAAAPAAARSWGGRTFTPPLAGGSRPIGQDRRPRNPLSPRPLTLRRLP